MKKTIVCILLTMSLLLTCFSALGEELAPDVQAIVDRGVLRVGVKNAVVGFGYQDTLTGE